jgi:predicted nucleotidyltransferase
VGLVSALAGTVSGVIRDEIITEAGRRLAAAAGPRSRVILFGSHARGDADERSDLDFLVIEPTVASRHEESVRLRRALRGLAVPADVIVVSEQQVDEWNGVHGTVINVALSEGRVLDGST